MKLMRMNTSITKTNRVGWLDNCKGFAIILVVIGHILSGYIGKNYFANHMPEMHYIYEFIYSFHMPLFFILSGYVFQMAYSIDIAQNKMRFKIQIMNNIYVYILWSCVQWAIKMLFDSDVNIKFTCDDLLLMPVKPMGIYWYIYVLILYYLLFYFWGKINLKDKYKLIITALISILGSFISVDFDFVFPLRRFLIYIFFFYLGMYVSKFPKTKIISGAAFAVYLSGSVISAVLIYVFDTRTLNAGAVGIISAMCLSMFVIYLFEKISFLKNAKVFNLFGIYSLEIYVTHNFITAANRIILLKLGITNFYFNLILNFIMAVFIPVICSFVLKKVKLHKAVFRPFSYLSDKKYSR